MSVALESLLALRRELIDDLREGEAEWIGRLREEALEAFESQGIPTRRLEAWKGTNLAPLEATRFDRIGTSEPNPIVVAGDGMPALHFMDGRLETANTQAENLPTGVRLLSFAEARRQAPELLENRLGGLAQAKHHALVALQTAFLDDGAVLSIDAGIELDTPLRLHFEVSGEASDDPSAAFPRLLVLAGERSRATIAIDHDSPAAGAPGLTAFVAEFYVGAEARIASVQTQNEASNRIHFTSMHARLEAQATFDSHVLSLSPGLVRSELEVALAEPGAETRMRGFYLGRGEGHVDHYTTVDHEAASCTSDEEYRGVLGDESAGVFRGRVIVRPDAQKTDARQSNPNLLISEGASADSKPQLEIYADDVKASHGSTTGQLDPEALFFLRARGIDESDGRLLLTRAFAREVLDAIHDERIRESVGPRVDEALEALTAARDRSIEDSQASDDIGDPIQ